MKQLLNRLKSKKGITLVELLVVLFVSSILLSIAMGMLTPINELMKSIKGNAHLDTLCNTANNYIQASVENASAITMVSYTAGSEDEVSAKFTALSTSVDVNFKSNINVIAILKNSEGRFRLYDFGKVVDTGVLENHLTSHYDNTYEVFRNSYYENQDYAVTIKTPTSPDGSSSIGWAEIESTCFNPEGNLSNQPRTLSFQFLQKTIKFIGNTATSSGDPTLPENDGTVIIYKSNDYSTPIVTPHTPGEGGDDEDGEDGEDEPTLPGVDDDDDDSTPPSPAERLEVSGAAKTISGNAQNLELSVSIKNKEGYFRVNSIRIEVDAPILVDKDKISYNCYSWNWDSKIYSYTQTTPNKDTQLHVDPNNKLIIDVNCDYLLGNQGTITIPNNWSSNGELLWANIVGSGEVTAKVYVNGDLIN